MPAMSEAAARRLLVVANLTESTPRLLAEIERRARDGSEFKLIVPPERHPDAPDWSPEDALELVRRAARGRPVALVDSGADAAATIGDLVEKGECDEILLSTPPEHHPHWHRHSLPKRIQALGIPVAVIPPDSEGWSVSHGFPDEWVRIEVGPLT
jgi:alkanesulfonate monooxygenase SsuD/methylene tetrahydromethanopterin reductase-like flavin-dependent oxidoreductase (luciferase family)